MTHSVDKRPRVGIGVFVWKDGKFLMGRRLSSHGDSTWSIPGGHLEYEESWEECAEREVLEETGLHITNIRFLAATNDIFPEHKKQYATIWMESDWLSGEPAVTEPDKWIDMQWREITDLPEPLFEPCWRNLKNAKPELFSLGRSA
jgi:8-oxo-dGTP diphosphatase